MTDFPEIECIHARMGLDYRLPNLESPLWVVQKVRIAHGEVIAAGLLRLTAETFLLIDPRLSEEAKARSVLELQPEVLSSAWQRGLDDIEARVPAETEQFFEPALLHLGWEKARSGWSPWTRGTK